MNIITIEKDRRSPILVGKLLEIWETSVRASHHFLTEADITRLAPQAEGALRHIETLWVMEDEQHPIGFMGVQGRKIEMLFLHPGYFRKGLGKTLVEQAFRDLNVEYVDVNEQNPDAKKFYERMGFKTFKRNECDSEGNPFPILEMKNYSFKLFFKIYTAKLLAGSSTSSRCPPTFNVFSTGTILSGFSNELSASRSSHESVTTRPSANASRFFNPSKAMPKCCAELLVLATLTMYSPLFLSYTALA